jgi:predicted RNA binding protein YcfA (HicA-like mRNA interferase family)
MKEYTEREILQLLKEHGFSLVRKGRHCIFGNSAGFTLPVPLGHKRISPGVVRDILKAIKASQQQISLKASNN